MSRLPTPGSDDGLWGTILNDFLSVEHNADGTLKSSGSLAAKAGDNTVVHNTGAETVAGVKTFTSAPVVPSGAFPESAIANLATDLSARLKYRGAWAASTAYAVNDLITFSGSSYVVTAAFTSGASFALTNLATLARRPGVYNVQEYGAKGDGTTDDTAAIKTAINTAFAAGVSNGTYYAEIYFPPAVYLIAGAPTTTGKGNAQIPLPVIEADPSGAPVGQQKFILIFKGTADATALYHWNQGAVQQAGAVLRTTYDAGSTIPTGGEVSVIGGPNPHNGFGGNTNVWDNLLVTVDGLTIEIPENGNICSFDFQGVAEVNVINASVLTRSSSAGASNPPSSPTWGWGLYMPQTNNNDMSNIGYYSCEGMVYGLIIQEHAQINSIRLISCYDGLVVWPSSGFPHRNVIAYASIENCTKAVVFASSGITKLDIQSLDIEPTSVLGQSKVIDDPHNAAVGTIYIGANGDTASLVSTTLSGQYGVNGASNLKLINSDQAVGAVTPPSIPSSTTALPNPWWRDAIVTLSGGTVTNITVDGKTQFTATPATVVVPSGKSITLTYSVAPTWQWTLL